jgi:hypothetical protein
MKNESQEEDTTGYSNSLSKSPGLFLICYSLHRLGLAAKSQEGTHEKSTSPSSMKNNQNTNQLI